MKRLLLLSTSKSAGEDFFQHLEPYVKSNFEGVRKILYVPYAIANHDKYASVMGEVLNKFGLKIISAHTDSNPVKLLDEVQGIYVSGGNTFRLLNALYKTDLIHAIPEKIQAGMPYMGSSAGTNVACPTIKTTNDMPIVFPPSLDAMGLVPFQINPHYFDPDPNVIQRGETRKERLVQYLEENTIPVIGLREGTAIKVVDDDIELVGSCAARLFRQDEPIVEVEPGTKVMDFI